MGNKLTEEEVVLYSGYYPVGAPVEILMFVPQKGKEMEPLYTGRVVGVSRRGIAVEGFDPVTRKSVVTLNAPRHDRFRLAYPHPAGGSLTALKDK